MSDLEELLVKIALLKPNSTSPEFDKGFREAQAQIMEMLERTNLELFNPYNFKASQSLDNNLDWDEPLIRFFRDD